MRRHTRKDDRDIQELRRLLAEQTEQIRRLNETIKRDNELVAKALADLLGGQFGSEVRW